MKDDHNNRMGEYKEKVKALVELDNYIKSTLDRSNYMTIRKLTTLYEIDVGSSFCFRAFSFL